MLSLRSYKIGTRLFLTTIGALGLMIVFVVIALYSLNTIGEKVDHIINNNVQKTSLAVDMRMRNLLIARHVRTALIYSGAEKQMGEKPKVDADFAKYLEDETKLLETSVSPRGKEIMSRILATRKAAETSIDQLFESIKTGNRADTEKVFFDNFRPRMQEWFDAVGEYVQLQRDNNDKDVADINAVKSNVQTTMLLLMALAAIVMVPAGIWVTRQITRPLNEAVALAESVAQGNLDNRIEHIGNDEPAQLMHALDKMQSDLKQRLEADTKVAAEMTRIKVALDVSSNSVMVADVNGIIIYCNKSVLEMMRNAEADLRTQLPGFRADAILGSNFDIYHKQPSHQRNMLAALRGIHRTEIGIGGRYFSLVACPILNDQGERLGTVVEWRDRTAEVLIENEVATIIGAAASGDFSRRLDASKMTGFFKQISEGINNLLEANTRALDDIGAMFSRLAQGNLTEKIHADYQGVLGVLKTDANSTVDNLQEIISSIKEATDAINTAAKEIASGNQDLSSRTEEQASSLEETAS
ncbi:MAG: Histidine kinase, region:Bacterial chemotaxis sensory transducer, partial [Proteobacteria bacterium]|nr:Histidine kinase, region:Bacterial chemotaxis sensory transducer [Pseudomonadota bacterium]